MAKRPRKPKGKHYRGYYRPHRINLEDGYGFVYFSKWGNRSRWAYQSKDGKVHRRGYHDADGKAIVTYSNGPGPEPHIKITQIDPPTLSKTDVSVREENA